MHNNPNAKEFLVPLGGKVSECWSVSLVIDHAYIIKNDNGQLITIPYNEFNNQTYGICNETETPPSEPIENSRLAQTNSFKMDINPNLVNDILSISLMENEAKNFNLQNLDLQGR